MVEIVGRENNKREEKIRVLGQKIGNSFWREKVSRGLRKVNRVEVQALTSLKPREGLSQPNRHALKVIISPIN